MSTIKVSALSSFDTTVDNVDFSYVLVLDTSNTVQDAVGSVVISPISSIQAEFWSTSSNTLTSLYSTVQSNSSITWNYQGVDVKTLSSNWQSTYTTVNTNSASAWVAPDGTKLPLSGGDITGPVSISAGTIINIPLTQIVLSADMVSVLSDAGKHFYHPVSDNNPRTFTIASNASVPYTIGTTLTIVNDMNVVTISINDDTMVLAGGISTGSRLLSTTGIATAMKVTSTRWVIGGSNIT